MLFLCSSDLLIVQCQIPSLCVTMAHKAWGNVLISNISHLVGKQFCNIVTLAKRMASMLTTYVSSDREMSKS